MLTSMIARQIDKLERRWGYDASYLRLVLRANPMSALKFGFVSQMADQRAAPAEAIAAVKIAGTLAEDCGPCVQIAVDMAAADGASPGPVWRGTWSPPIRGVTKSSGAGARRA